MIVDTLRFGPVEIDGDRLITFAKGLLGFSRYKRFVLIQSDRESCFWWLQSIETSDLAFVVTDPSLFVTTYQVPIRPEQMQGIGLESLEDAQVLVIVNKRDDVLTGNLQGPLLVHLQNRMAEQLVLTDRQFTTCTPLMKLESNVEAMAV